jgi:RNA polymerase sigma-70 factor (ECF subfamily)
MDEELVAALREREPEALKEVVGLYGDRLLRSAYLLCGNASEAQDMVQETFLQAIRSADRFRGQSAIYTWLRGILLNLSRHYHRKHNRLVYDEQLANEEPAENSDSPDRLDLEVTSAALMNALRQLSLPHREVLILRYYEDMKICPHQSTRLLTPLLALTCLATALAATEENMERFSQVVPYELGDAQFAPGDNITIEQIRGTKDGIAKGGAYCVQGTYSLSSKEEALLALFMTSVGPSGSSEVAPNQTVRIKKGTGSFRLFKTMDEDGYLHLSFYPIPNGGDFGGVYFGQGKWVYRSNGTSHRESDAQPAHHTAAAVEDRILVTGANRVMLEYLGNPVEPPAAMESAYTKEGLTQAIRQAARMAGVSVGRIEIDNSEYPYLIGVVCEEDDYNKMIDQVRKMAPYDYSGSVGSHNLHAFNIVPYRAYPPELGQRIGRRTTLRQQMLYDRISGSN